MRAVVTFFLLYIVLPLAAQTPPAFTARAEFPVRNLNSEFQVFPLPDSSALVLNRESYFRSTSEKYSFYKLDSALKTTWFLPADLPKGAAFAHAAFDKNTAYFLFETFKAAEWLLLRLNLKQPRFQLTKHYLPPATSFFASELKVLNGFLFLTGTHNNRLTVLHLNPAEDRFTRLPAIYDQASALTEFNIDTVADRAEFIVTESNGLKARLQVKRLSEPGRLYSLNFIQSKQDMNFLAGRLTSGDSTRKLVIGTYSPWDLRYAQGFFATPLLQLPGQSVKYYDFTRFSHYFDYLAPRRRTRLRRKISQLQDTPKTYRLRKRILLHPLRPFKEGYLLVGELYMPRYQGTAGNPRIFDGFDYQQTIVAAFGSEGELWWENSFPITNIRHFDLQEAITIGINGETIILCYPEDNRIRYKVMNGSETTPNDQFMEITKALPGERIFNNRTDGVAAWYGPHFLIFGNQQVRSRAGNRRIFRIDKLSF